MPGIIVANKPLRVITKQVGADSFLCEPTVLFSNDDIYIGAALYEGYPLNIYEDSDLLIVQEGEIYNRASVDVRNFAKSLAQFKKFSEEQSENAKQFVLESDGEFILTILNKKSGNFILLNDALGRLPLYYYISGDREFIFSREMRFIYPFMKKISFDRQSIIEYLFIGGYPLEDRTLVDGILRLSPASMLVLDRYENEMSLKTLFIWDFSVKRGSVKQYKSRKEIAADLEDLFLASLSNRQEKLKNYTNVLLLSSGKDSRAVLAGFSKLRIPHSIVTFNLIDSKEGTYTKKLANVFKEKVTLLEVKEHPNLSGSQKLIEMKDGLNSIVHSASFSILGDIKKLGKPIALYSGLYWGELLRPNSLSSGMKSIKQLAEFIICDSPHGYNSREISKILQVNKDEVIRDVMAVLMKYPEDDIYMKYAHLSFGCTYKFIQEGEDRNRYFFWTVSPLYSLPIFKYVISNIPKRDRRNVVLLKEFLLKLDKRTCEVDAYGDKTLTNRFWAVLHRFIFTMLSNTIITKIARKISRLRSSLTYSFSTNKSTHPLSSKNPELANHILNILDSSPTVKGLFKIDYVRKLIQNEIGSVRFYRLATILLYINYIENLSCGTHYEHYDM